MIDRIERGLEIAEREMLEEKAKNNEDGIVCADDNVIQHISAKIFFKHNLLEPIKRKHS